VSTLRKKADIKECGDITDSTVRLKNGLATVVNSKEVPVVSSAIHDALPRDSLSVIVAFCHFYVVKREASGSKKLVEMEDRGYYRRNYRVTRA